MPNAANQVPANIAVGQPGCPSFGALHLHRRSPSDAPPVQRQNHGAERGPRRFRVRTGCPCSAHLLGPFRSQAAKCVSMLRLGSAHAAGWQELMDGCFVERVLGIIAEPKELLSMAGHWQLGLNALELDLHNSVGEILVYHITIQSCHLVIKHHQMTLCKPEKAWHCAQFCLQHRQFLPLQLAWTKNRANKRYTLGPTWSSKLPNELPELRCKRTSNTFQLARNAGTSSRVPPNPSGMRVAGSFQSRGAKFRERSNVAPVKRSAHTPSSEFWVSLPLILPGKPWSPWSTRVFRFPPRPAATASWLLN